MASSPPAIVTLGSPPQERPVITEIATSGATMKNSVSNSTRPVDRRSFMKSGLLAGGAAAVGAGLLANGTSARAQERGRLGKGDAAILRFLAAAELIESDLWTQYAELGGIGNNPPIEVTNPNPPQLNNY